MAEIDEDSLCSVFLDFADEQKDVKVWEAITRSAIIDEAWDDIVAAAYIVIGENPELE